MIKSREDLSFYLNEDFKRFKYIKPTFKDLIVQNEMWYIYNYQRHLRYYEYYLNVHNRYRNPFFFYHFLLYKRLGFKLRFTIYPNTVGPGMRIFHTGDFLHVKQKCTIGKNCSLLPGVVIGNKHLNDDGSVVTVGDNCYFGLGSKVFGQVAIGDDVVIGANAVVIHDVPSNCVVAGIPAKIIKKKHEVRMLVNLAAGNLSGCQRSRTNDSTKNMVAQEF